jgi:hypothetical protein
MIPRTDSCWYAEGSGVQNCLPAPPVWIDDGQEGQFSLERLAMVSAPILWFSPREFLLLENRSDETPGRIRGKPVGRTVYYRIREFRLRAAGAAPSKIDATRVRSPGEVWRRSGPEFPLERLERVFMQYFFYYPEDRGIGGHPHDLEALEVQVEMRRVCIGVASLDSGRTRTQRTTSANCMIGATVRSVSGSAHGIGWYTNTLLVDATRDTVLPLTVLVEENKHASVPDRDGDGRYMPHYDVNRQVNDAWGVRDVAGTGWLGGPEFRAELIRDRDTRDQVCPPEIPTRLKDYYRFHRRELDGDGCIEQERTYSVLLAEGEDVCRGGEPDVDDPRLRNLMRDKHFCWPPRRTRLVPPRSALGRGLRRTLTEISPGPNGEFGFQNAMQRLSFAYRSDGGHGVSGILPLGREVPVIGGWTVIKLNAIFERLDGALPPVERGSVEARMRPQHPVRLIGTAVLEPRAIVPRNKMTERGSRSPS